MPEPELAPKEREIVEGELYTRQLCDLKIQYARLDEAFENMGLALCRRPDIFPQVPGTNLRRIKINEGINLPALRVWFRHDDNFIYLECVELADDLSL